MRQAVLLLSGLAIFALALPALAGSPLRSGNVVRGAVLRLNSSSTWVPDAAHAVKRARSAGASSVSRRAARPRKSSRTVQNRPGRSARSAKTNKRG